MKFLITGGAGFIGSRLAQRLIEAGHFVFVLDNLSTGNLENLRSVRQSKKLSFKKETVLDKNAVRSLSKQCDGIFHLAASVGVKVVMNKPLASFLNNTEGTKNVLDSATEYHLPVLVASSSEVYGKSQKVPYKEEGDRSYGSIYNLRWGYALSKSVDEFLALTYAQEKGTQSVVARFFNTVGPGQSSRYGMVIPTFVARALNGEPLPVYGDGKQIRCFCHVSDTVRALTPLLLTKKSYGEVFNLGSKEAITIYNLAQKILELTRSKSKIITIPKRIMMKETGDEMRVRIPDISKIRKRIGWHPTIRLNRIIQDVIRARHTSGAPARLSGGRARTLPPASSALQK